MKKSAIDRFMEKIQVSDSGCWLWTAYVMPNGYGTFRLPRSSYGTFKDGKSMVLAHRFAYEALVGPIPDGASIDHLCRVRHCVNPEHLEPVTQRINVLRGESGPAHNARKTHCKRGHELTPDNVAIRTLRDGGPSRVCITCRRIYMRARYAMTKSLATQASGR
jgi:hypothetical protein